MAVYTRSVGGADEVDLYNAPGASTMLETLNEITLSRWVKNPLPTLRGL